MQEWTTFHGWIICGWSSSIGVVCPLWGSLWTIVSNITFGLTVSLSLIWLYVLLISKEEQSIWITETRLQQLFKNVILQNVGTTIYTSHIYFSYITQHDLVLANIVNSNIDFPQETDDTQSQREIAYSGKPRESKMWTTHSF